MIKRLFKKWFINPVIKSKIKELELNPTYPDDFKLKKLNQQEKANLFCKENEIQFAINVLNEIL